jgi:hypothetical protein
VVFEKAQAGCGGLLITTLDAAQKAFLETLIDVGATGRRTILSISQKKLNILIHIKDF